MGDEDTTCAEVNRELVCFLPDDHLGPHKGLQRNESELFGEFGPRYLVLEWGWKHLQGDDEPIPMIVLEVKDNASEEE